MIGRVLAALFASPPSPPSPTGRDVDYTLARAGHNYVPFPSGCWLGWGPLDPDDTRAAPLRVGDELITLTRRGGRQVRARWLVLAVEYYTDPADMWRARVRSLDGVPA